MDWAVITLPTLTREALTALLANDVGAVRVPHFVSEERCSLAVRGIMARGLDYYENVYPRIGRIGITQFEHRAQVDGKAQYFSKTSEAHCTRRSILAESGDLLDDVVAALGRAWQHPAGVAVEEDTGQRYFAGLVRVIGKALIHLDWAGLDAPDWSIGRISAQLAWNIFLQMGSSGGSTKVYRRQWCSADEAHQLPNSYGYDPQVVAECACIEIVPQCGDLVLFNSRNFHEVDVTSGTVERITLSSFIGHVDEPNQELVLWS